MLFAPGPTRLNPCITLFAKELLYKSSHLQLILIVKIIMTFFLLQVASASMFPAMIRLLFRNTFHMLQVTLTRLCSTLPSFSLTVSSSESRTARRRSVCPTSRRRLCARTPCRWGPSPSTPGT